LLAELKRIEGQQQQLKTAAAENKVLIVHPVKGFNLDEDDEYAEEEEEKPNPDRFIPSGLTTKKLVLKYAQLAPTPMHARSSCGCIHSNAQHIFMVQQLACVDIHNFHDILLLSWTDCCSMHANQAPMTVHSIN